MKVSGTSWKYCRGFARLHKAIGGSGKEGGWVRGGEGESLSPSSLRDIPDRIALTNKHLSATVTWRQIKRSETGPRQSASDMINKLWHYMHYVLFLALMHVLSLSKHVCFGI